MEFDNYRRIGLILDPYFINTGFITAACIVYLPFKLMHNYTRLIRVLLWFLFIYGVSSAYAVEKFASVDKAVVVADLLEKSKLSVNADASVSSQMLARAYGLISEIPSQCEQARLLLAGAKIYKSFKACNESMLWLNEALKKASKEEDPQTYFEIRISQVDVLRLDRKYAVAQEHLDLLAKDLKGVDDPRTLMSFCTLKANLLKNQNLFTEAMDVFLEALEHAKRLNDNERVMRMYVNLSLVAQKIPDMQVALSYALEGLAYVNTQSDPEEIANLTERVAEIYRYFGKYAESIQYSNQAIRIFSELSDNAGLINAHSNLATVYRRIGLYDKSLESSIVANRLSVNAEDYKSICLTTNNIGLLYLNLGMDDEALDYYTKCHEIARNHHFDDYIASSLNNMAELMGKRGDYADAIAKSQLALDIYTRINHAAGRFSVFRNLGLFHYIIGDLAQSKHYFDNLFELANKSKEKRFMTIALLNLGQIRFDAEDFVGAQADFERALSLSVELEIESLEQEAHTKLLHLFRKIEDFQASTFHARRSLMLLQSIYNVDLNSKILDLVRFNAIEGNERKLDLLLKGQEIDKLELLRQQTELDALHGEQVISELQLTKAGYLRYLLIGLSIPFILFLVTIYSRYKIIRKTEELTAQKNQQILQKNIELEALNASKDKLFSIIAHDLRGPISSLISLVDILNMEFQEASRAQIREYVSEMEKASTATFRLLENLLDWASLQIRRVEANPERIQVLSVLNDVIAQIQSIAHAKKINIELNIPHDLVLFVDKNMMATVFRNLLSNGIKFSNENGLIRVSAVTNTASVELSVQDYGVGMTPETCQRIFKVESTHTTRGTLGEKGSGLGLVICKDLVEKNNGSIAVSSEVGKGTCFKVSFPISA
jgi:signal transduction histidine kinase/Tfp pilus assembly protein PilF